MPGKRTGVLMMAHGSKRHESNKEFIELCEEVRFENSANFACIDHAFLEFENPTIASAIESMYQKGLEKIYIYPFFLNAGKHVHVDIPRLITRVQTNYPDMEIEIMKHFGASEGIAQRIFSDLRSVL